MLTVQRINCLIDRAKKRKSPLPFIVTFKDGSKKCFDGGQIIYILSQGENGIIGIETAAGTEGQGILADLLYGLVGSEGKEDTDLLCM